MNDLEGEYKIVNGTYFNIETDDKVVKVLESARKNGTRVRLVLGNKDTGESWNEEYDVSGTIGRSMGPHKVPLLIHSSRSIGGPSVLDNCIIGIRHSNRKNGGWLYRHPKYAGNE